MKTENLSKQELQEINKTLTNFISKKISLKELLEYFQIEYFLDYGYTICSYYFTTRVTMEESSINSLFGPYQNILKYPALRKWKELCDKVDFWYNLDRRGCTLFPINYIRHKVSEIDWSMYEFHLRPYKISSRVLREYRCIDNTFYPPDNYDYLVATDKVLNVLTNIAYVKENGLEKYRNESFRKF